MKAIEVCIVRQDEVHSQVLETTSRTHIVKTSSHDNLPPQESIQDLVPTWADLQSKSFKIRQQLHSPYDATSSCNTLLNIKKNYVQSFSSP
jgi:hypothetical protein